MSTTNDAVDTATEAGAETTRNRRIALLIAVLALFLAASEMIGNNAKQDVQVSNVEAANLWAFFQARTIRREIVLASATEAELRLPTISDEAVRAATQAQITRWRAEAARFDSEPATREGRRELMERARAKEAERALATARDGWFDFASAALQLGIVMASAAIITGIIPLAIAGGAAGLVGIALGAVGWFAPTLLG